MTGLFRLKKNKNPDQIQERNHEMITMDKIRRAAIMFFSACTVLYCIYTNFLLSPVGIFAPRFLPRHGVYPLFPDPASAAEERMGQYSVFCLAALGGVAVCIYMAIEEHRISDNYYRAKEADFYVFLVYIVSIMIVISRMSGGVIVAFMGLVGTLLCLYGSLRTGIVRPQPLLAFAIHHDGADRCG